MEPNVYKIKNIIRLEDYYENINLFNHLFEVQLPPNDLKSWRPRYNYEIGNLLVGDLILDLEKENTLEVHPFPEWVVHLRTINPTNSIPYLIVPNLPNSFMKKLNRKNIDQRTVLVQEKIKNLKIDDFIAFEYKIGVNVLIHAFTPHLFISSKVNKEIGDIGSYLQVFEPNFELFTKILKIKTTYFFKIPFSVII
ncbi:MAG: hypothetical protein ACTSQJ_17060 [Promethearchaeota archaeon]